ncbi:MAG: sigma-70 family RNA polymerase sigma factor [Bryobacterales bacterium]|nr:sigma-70 family RNA polymerase sigma factor [Bryobacterales bacterium]
MSTPPDRELVEQARGGDGAATGELFTRYWRAARAAAFAITGEFASAEDAAAEALQEALSGLNRLREPERFGSWLRTIVVRKARHARHSRGDGTDARDLPAREERPDDALARLELEALVKQAIRELPVPLREALVLVYLEGYNTGVAARFLNIPPGTLRRRLHDGRARLRASVETALQGRKPMNQERENKVGRLRAMIDSGEIYGALRESLALRPVPEELIDRIRKLERVSVPAALAERFLAPSERVADAGDPVGAIAAAIRKTLPEFQEWTFDARKAAKSMPPGFAEGRPGAFARVTRALVRVSASGETQTMYELLEDSPDEQAFRGVKGDMRFSDVLDLVWMETGPLELRSVQALLERVAAAVLPGAKVRITGYDEPRYRSALQLHFGGVPARAAYGGVLSGWSGCPEGAGSAHLRIFLEPWASLLGMGPGA